MGICSRSEAGTAAKAAPKTPATSTTAPCPLSTTQKAINNIKASDFAKTEEGKKVVKKIEALQKDGKIEHASLAGTKRGEWNGSKIRASDKYKDDPDATASELVHEATHALNEDEHPASKTKNTIDEEMRTNDNQLDYYETQRAGGFRDPELERRKGLRKDGKLRDDVKSRYPTLAEHL